MTCGALQALPTQAVRGKQRRAHQRAPAADYPERDCNGWRRDMAAKSKQCATHRARNSCRFELGPERRHLPEYCRELLSGVERKDSWPGSDRMQYRFDNQYRMVTDRGRCRFVPP